jgi:hypothetical protein
MWPESWHQDNIIENKSKQIIKINSQLIKYGRMKLRKKIN